MSTYIPVALRKHIQEQFAHCCAYCQTAESLTVVTFEIEHIVPQSAGGTTTPENLCLACPACNRYKAVQQTAVDPLTNQTVSLFHPQQQRWLDHFVWNEDATGIDKSGGVEHISDALGYLVCELYPLRRPTRVEQHRL